jgi:hypothetical protein
MSFGSNCFYSVLLYFNIFIASDHIFSYSIQRSRSDSLVKMDIILDSNHDIISQKNAQNCKTRIIKIENDGNIHFFIFVHVNFGYHSKSRSSVNHAH